MPHDQESEMESELPPSGFANVDRDADPMELIRLLDVRQASTFRKQYRELAVTLLALNGSERVLDVGCGTGEDVRHLAEIVGPDGLAIGVDSSERMILEARARHGGMDFPLEFHLGDAGHLDFADDEFDGCISIRTFQHLALPQRALKEIVRVVRPGGRVVVVDPDHDTAVIDVPDRQLMRKFLNFRADRIQNGGIAHQMPAMFRQAGLDNVSTIPMTEIRTDYSQVDDASHFEGGIRIAGQSGVLTPDEVERLIEAMRSAASSDLFFTSMTYFVTAGRKR